MLWKSPNCVERMYSESVLSQGAQGGERWQRESARTCASQIGSSLGDTQATPCSNPTTAYSLSGLLTTSKVPTLPLDDAEAEGRGREPSDWSGTATRSEPWSARMACRCEKVPCARCPSRISICARESCKETGRNDGPCRCPARRAGCGRPRARATRKRAPRPSQSRDLGPSRATGRAC